MPQFDPANFVPQMAWLVLAFAILYFGIVRATLPRLSRTIDARENQVTGDIAAAEKAKQGADAMQADYDAGVAAAQERARAKLAEVRASAGKATEERLAAAAAALTAKADAAAASLAQAQKRALADIEGVAADVASDIVEKLIGTRPAIGDAAQAAKTALG